MKMVFQACFDVKKVWYHYDSGGKGVMWQYLVILVWCISAVRSRYRVICVRKTFACKNFDF